MQAPDLWLLVFSIAALLVALGATAGFINNRLWVSEPLACAAFGVAIGPLGLGLLRLPVGHSAQAAEFLREIARLTLAIAVIGAAMQVPQEWLRRHWRGMLVALGPGMLAMWASASILTAIFFAWPPLTSIVIGAAVSPTDPVLAAPVLSGALAQRHIPADLRNALTAESGANDGLAWPFVMLPVLLLADPPGAALSRWAVHVLLWQIGSAIAVGAGLGAIAGCALDWAARRRDAEPSSLLTVAIALSVAALAAMRVLDGDGILASFVAGITLSYGLRDIRRLRQQAQERQERFNEALGRFFDLPVMVLFGAALPWHSWLDLGWRGIGFAAAMLLIRRPPVWLALHRLMPWTRSRPQALFAGWFGPVGVSALFYATVAGPRTGLPQIWPTVSLVVAASVLAHGVSGTPLATLLKARPSDAPPKDAEKSEG